MRFIVGNAMIIIGSICIGYSIRGLLISRNANKSK